MLESEKKLISERRTTSSFISLVKKYVIEKVIDNPPSDIQIS
ncbi:MAG: hypothetical protein QMB63_00120 [Clostridiaceae bacterium]